MKKVITGLIIVLLIGAAVGAVVGACGYWGRWVDCQYSNIPVKKPIDVIKVSEPESVFPGDEFTVVYEVTNINPNKPYEMTDCFYGNWEVVKYCSISVTDTSKPEPTSTLFRQTFTANDTVKMDFQREGESKPMTSASARGPEYNNYCQVFYTIPAGATCRIEAKVTVRNDSPSEETASDWYFDYSLDTFYGRDEIPYWYGDGEGKS